jgi:hypothetical protein
MKSVIRIITETMVTDSVTLCSVLILIFDFILTRVLFSILHW